MCGIFGYVGDRDPLKTCISGLERLEYRGYDSTGIAGIIDGKIALCKEVGKLAKLKEKLTLQRLEVAIGHTRWATHGKVTQENAHPHPDHQAGLALVHNGIIENCDSLREALEKEGILFRSETDTEVIANLISKFYKGNLIDALKQALFLVKGQFAIALVHKNHPGQIIASAKESPLSIGVDEKGSESILSSDPNAFLGKRLHVLFLKDGEIAVVEKGKVAVFDSLLNPIQKKTEIFDSSFTPPSKEGYEHYMLKEIYEQPLAIQRAYLGRIDEEKVAFESFPDIYRSAASVCFIGCGTSAHAGAIGALYLEDLAHIPAHSEIASEARYRIFPKNTLVVALSQSGETADTLAAVKEAKAQGRKVIGICNVKNASLTREVDHCIFLKAGPEMSVCSTKAFTSQMAVLYLFALYMAGKGEVEALKKLPSHIEQVLQKSAQIEEMAKKYSRYDNFFFMGRRYMYPTCMEAALKLKEISYVHAAGYAAGELKHGAIALIDEHFPVVAFCADARTEEKILSNLQEVKARKAPIIAFAPEHLKGLAKIADDCVWLPTICDPLSPFASTVAGQLFAYFLAKERGCDIDQPRNLAKSVTVQ